MATEVQVSCCVDFFQVSMTCFLVCYMESTQDLDMEIEKKKKNKDKNKDNKKRNIVVFSPRFTHPKTQNITSSWVRNRGIRIWDYSGCDVKTRTYVDTFFEPNKQKRIKKKVKYTWKIKYNSNLVQNFKHLRKIYKPSSSSSSGS